ncbi:uncharacterized protein V6R79_018953 [Siganus canaliculatus]
MAEESAVKVCVRVRPLIAREESGASESEEPIQLFWKAEKKSIHLIDDGNSAKSFSFDRVFTADETTNHLYQEIAKPLVVSSVQGYNGTIFAYGQTSSGKTFTMMGSDRVNGVIPLAVEDVFHTIKNCPKKEFLLRVSYMEIYNETVTDLLVDSWKRKPLEVRETINKNIYVADLTEELVTSPAQALAWIRKGEKNRHYGKTKMNQRSSRSHTIFRMILESRERSDPASGENADGAIIVSHLNLVDLAGSERASQTGAEGTRFKEGCNINRSLFTLGQVIKKLTDESQKGFTNYRDSKLTRILQNSLGGNAKTVIICTVTPVALDETLSTLQFASTAKKMKNDPHVTEVSDDGALLKRYRNEIVDLKRRLQEASFCWSCSVWPVDRQQNFLPSADVWMTSLQVSSVTQTTATEKEVLSQLLQEKDQLQREQQDRIKNLTKLLVTSSNSVPVQKMPKRRVTWGGKMLRLARTSTGGDMSSDLSFAESFSGRKRKADRSCLSELGEEDEDFDTHWEIPDEPPDEMDMSQASVTVRSFGESPKDASPGRMRELEMQLQAETQQREEALEKIQTAEQRAAELELQLQTEAQQREEALEKIQTAEQRAAELELQLQTEAQQREEAWEKIQVVEQRAAELELQLQLHLRSEPQQREEALEKMQMSEERAAEMELQLQTEAQQREEALEKMQMSEQRAAELELQLQTEAQQREEALEKIQTAEQRAAELELQLQTEAQQKQEATEKLEMLEFRVSDLENQLEERSHSQSESDEQMRKEFGETIQLCETLAAEKDMLVDERDYLKQELGMFIEQIATLEKENGSLSKELEEKREVDEFKSLEEEFRKEHENELQNEIRSLKTSVEASEAQRLELQKKMESLSEELKKKSDFADELQTMNGKDLVQEVAKLRRSLDDAEGLSRDTKKEWAVLRSEKLSLDETVATLTVNHEKLDNEVNSLRFQLDTEKSRYRKMQSDLQKELNMAFDDNTKLTALLDGKVPKNLIDSVELERRVTDLNKELTASRQAEEALRAQVDEAQTLTKQLSDLNQELSAAQVQTESLLAAQAQSQDEAEQLRASLQTSEEETVKVRADLSAAALREQELHQQLDAIRSDLERSEAEKTQFQATAQEVQLKLQDDERLDKLDELQQLVKDLEEKLSDSESSRATEEEISKELQEQLTQLTAELQCVRAEKEQTAQSSADDMETLLSKATCLTAERDQLRTDLDKNLQMAAETQVLLQSLQDELQAQKQRNMDLENVSEQKDSDISDLSQELQRVRAEKEAGGLSSAEEQEMEKLLSTVASLTAERDQLKLDMQENVEMMIENQEELRTALEKNREQKERIRQLESERAAVQDGPSPSPSAQKDELQVQIQTLTETLESVQAERDALASERTADARTHGEETEKLLLRVTSLSEERDQLQEILEGLRQEKKQLQAELEDRMEMEVIRAQSELQQPELQANDERTTQLQQEMEQLQATLRVVNEQKSQLEEDLQRNVEMATETQNLLHSLQQQLQEQSQRNVELDELSRERQAELEQQVAQTQCLLSSLQEELQEQKQQSSERTKLSEQKEADLEQQMRTLTEQLESAQAERDALLYEKEAGAQTSTEETEKLQHRVTSLCEERDQLQEALEGLRQEKQQLRAELDDRMETMQCELQQLDSVEPRSLKDEQEAERVLQMQQLEELLENTKAELNQVKSDLRENVELMIENQEELRVSQERVAALQDELNLIRSQKAELETRQSDDAETSSQSLQLQNQIQTLREELESIRAERDVLASERTADAQTHSEETEKLQRRATSLSEDRDQLQEALERLREEKQQLRAELEDRMEMLQAEIMELKMSLQTVSEQKRKLEDDLQQNMNKTSTTQELLTSIQDELCEQKQLSLEKESSLDQQLRALTERLEAAEAERDTLLSEQQSSRQMSSEERDELQGALERLRQEKQQLRAELDDRMEKMSAVQQKLDMETQRGERVTELQQEMQQLEQQLQTSRERQTQAEAEAESSQQMLREASSTISTLQEQLNALPLSASAVKETASSRLEDSSRKLQDAFRRFQHFIETCSKHKSSILDKAHRVHWTVQHTYLASLPKSTRDTHSAVSQLETQCTQSLGTIMEQLQVQAQVCRDLFEALVKKDLSVFEERRLQDILLCRAHAPSYSVKDQDFHTLWDQRLSELLDRRQLYLQKMANTSEKLGARLAHFPSELSAEVKERERFKEAVKAAFANEANRFSRFDTVLRAELDRRSAVLRSRKTTLQAIGDEHSALREELKLLNAQAEAQLQDERSKNSTLLQALKGAPLKAELSLLNDNQQLVQKLQHAEGKLKTLLNQVEQLEDAQVKANNRVSTHKEATQLLQTELQDSRAQVDEREKTIQVLKSKLRESEKNASPSAVELEKLRNQLFKKEVELSTASDKHQQEIQRMTTVLQEKEESLRKLKENLRKSQQQGEESFLQGEDLHARLTNPRGLVMKSSIMLEKAKLEEEVKQLQQKIAELESLLSSQQMEISKWRSRAFKLKGKTKSEADRPSSPCTPTKRVFPVTSDSSYLLSSPKKFLVTPKKVLDSPRQVVESPRKILDSPKTSVLRSPKSRFFDVGGNSELLSRTCPKQFFDNSSLGTIPDAVTAADRKDEWWPQSPKQEDMCKTQ